MVYAVVAVGPSNLPSSLICRATSSSSSLAFDATCIKRAAHLADKSAGFTAPHPNFGCVIATADAEERSVVGEGYLYAQGTTPPEVQAVQASGDRCRGATAYLNLEPSHCLGDQTAVSALIQVNSHPPISILYIVLLNLVLRPQFVWISDNTCLSVSWNWDYMLESFWIVRGNYYAYDQGTTFACIAADLGSYSMLDLSSCSLNSFGIKTTNALSGDIYCST